MSAPRPYRSTLRAERAADTRLRIVRAAGELFAADGFTTTTVAAIARRAGVAAPTVYATFGSKGAIVRALLDQYEDDAGAVTRRAAIDAEPDPRRKLELFARWSRQLFSTLRPILVATREAAADPSVAALHEQGDAHAREWQTRIVDDIARAGALRRQPPGRQAVDIMRALSGPELYLRVVDGAGWSDEAYEGWLADLLVQQLLGEPEN